MKVLIAIVNAHSRLAYQQAIRDTWLPLVHGADVKFFLGPSDRAPKDDEVFLKCDDAYLGLPSKVRAIMRWSSEHGYEHTLKCDDDVVLCPDKLLNSGFQSADFVGHRNDIRPFPVPYGFCYWLSRKTMQLVAESELPRDGNDEVWVTRVLSQSGIALRHDPRYVMHSGRREEFISTGQRVLRTRPLRIFAPHTPVASDAFARCIHITWTGYHKLPEDRAIEEFKKVFADTQQR